MKANPSATITDLVSGAPTGMGTRFSYECLRCGHEWVSSSEAPVRCTACRTTAWDKPAARKVETSEFEAGTKCFKTGCRFKPRILHPTLAVPVCNRHGNPALVDGVEQPRFHKANQSGSLIVAGDQHGRVQAPWANIRDSAAGLNGEVVIKVAGSHCITCGEGISRNYKMCRTCFQNLSPIEQRAEIQRLRGRSIARKMAIRERFR